MKKIFFLVFVLLSLVGCNKNKFNEDLITKDDFNKAIEMVETNATIKTISFLDDYKESIIEIDNNKYHCLVNYNEDLTKESYYEKKDDLLFVYEDLNGNFLRQIANDDSFIALNLNINYNLLIYSKKENCYIYKNDATTTNYYFSNNLISSYDVYDNSTSMLLKTIIIYDYGVTKVNLPVYVFYGVNQFTSDWINEEISNGTIFSLSDLIKLIGEVDQIGEKMVIWSVEDEEKEAILYVIFIDYKAYSASYVEKSK